MPKLNELPEHQRTRRWIHSEIIYETHQGIHTYHACDCGRGSCRDRYCVKCWEELLSQLEKGERSEP